VTRDAKKQAQQTWFLFAAAQLPSHTQTTQTLHSQLHNTTNKPKMAPNARTSHHKQLDNPTQITPTTQVTSYTKPYTTNTAIGEENTTTNNRKTPLPYTIIHHHRHTRRLHHFRPNHIKATTEDLDGTPKPLWLPAPSYKTAKDNT